MKVGKWNIGDVYLTASDGRRQYLNVSEAVQKVPLAYIQAFYEEQGKFNPMNADLSEYMIGGPWTYELKDWGSRPTIIVIRDAIQPMLRKGMSMKEFTYLQNGGNVYHDLVQAGVSIYSIASNGLYAEQIATEILDLFWRLVPEVKRAGIFEILQINMGKEAKFEGGAIENLKMVPIQISFTMETRWSVTIAETEDPEDIETRKVKGFSTSGACEVDYEFEE